MKRITDGWRAAIEEMQRPGWRDVLAETRRDVAARRGVSLEVFLEQRGLANAR